MQPLFSALHRLSLLGMNVGGGSDVDGSGERSVLQLIRRTTAGKRLVVFDVGANVGDYARMVSDELGDDLDIHCFEPSS